MHFFFSRWLSLDPLKAASLLKLERVKSPSDPVEGWMRAGERTVSKHRVTVLMVLSSVGRFVSLSGGAGAAALCRVRRFGQGSAAAFWKGPKSTRFRLRGPHVVLCFYKLVKLLPLLACSLCRPSHGVHSAV